MSLGDLLSNRLEKPITEIFLPTIIDTNENLLKYNF